MQLSSAISWCLLLGALMFCGGNVVHADSKYPVTWSLDCLYDSVCSEGIDNDKNEISKMIDIFTKKYKGNLSIESLANAVCEYDAIVRDSLKPYVYLNLSHKKNIKDVETSAAYQKICEWWADSFAKLSWFVGEIQKLDYNNVKELLGKIREFTEYAAFIEEVFKFKDYTLSPSEEFVLTKLSLVTGQTWYKLHEDILSRIEIFIGRKKYGISGAVELANHGKTESIRKRATEALSRELAKNSITLLAVINNVALSHKVVYSDLRRYNTPEANRFLEDKVLDAAVNAMIAAIASKCAAICHRYYKIKAKLLGRKKIQYWDRCSVVKISGKRDHKFTYDEAVGIVLRIFGDFSEKFHDIAMRMVSDGWVDVYPADGKVSGAFACPTNVNGHPFILLNFYGTTRDVLTMAHEFGHGIHQTLSAKNKQLVTDPGLNISETASLFSEKLVNKYLLSKEKDQKMKIEIMCSALDDVMSTVFRQVAFFKFEQRIHRLRVEKELSCDIVNKVWREVLSESMGDSVELDPSIDNLWGYITHFTSCPFYVYSYAFGYLFVQKLYLEYEKNGKEFVKKYEEVLSSGGTMDYRQIAQFFNLDADSEDFWSTALEVIEKEVDELEALCDRTLRN
ncbi:MAG: M3 family metallopeptidase [Holosporales bacterium]|jgi:oligoendopeptidase F|nr:M3 family metallopeptidase [Holosporales bacterium]